MATSARAKAMEELQRVTTTAVDQCLPFIIKNINIINAGSATHLLGDFRANVICPHGLTVGNGTWIGLVSFDVLVMNIDDEEEYKNKKLLFISFLMNDRVVEGYRTAQK